MKRIILVLLFCGASFDVLAAGTRNLIMPIDWGKENFEKEFSKSQFQLQSEEFGATTQTLMMALLEKAAPIIVSSATWGNLIARATLFRDAVQNRDLSYMQRYPLFANPQNISALKRELLSGYDPKTDLMYQGAPNNGQLYYYFAYQIFFSKNPAFKPNEWIVKKLSDYLYLFIPHSYVQELVARQDTPMSDQIEYEVGKKQNVQLSTPLSPYERLVGMNFEKFPDMPASVALDMYAHPTRMNYNNYKNLAPKRAWPMIQKLVQYKWEDILKGFLFGQHFVHVVSQLLVTHSDIKFPGGIKANTDVNEAYFLHEWLVYFDGHGSVSQTGPVMPVVTETPYGGGGVQTQAQIAFTVGIEQGAFRELLGLFNNQVNTGSLLYVSCYSGGPHLFKLFEHHWDYPKTQQVGKRLQVTKYAQAAPDVFNYLIIATNQFYTTTYSPTVGFWFDNPNYWPRLPGKPQYMKQQKGGQEKPNGLEFENYFRSMAQLLHPEFKGMSTKSGAKKQKTVRPPTLKQDLIRTISYVHQFNFSKNYMIPAIRLPYTEWFVSLADLGEQIRLESDQARGAREQQEAQVKKLLEATLKKKGLPEKVKESMQKYELASPDEKARIAKELREKEEQDRKERELFERMEKMRQEQAEREKAKVKPPVTKPQAPKPEPKKPLQPLPTQPQVELPPMGGVKPPSAEKLPPPPVITPGVKPPTKLPPPPVMPGVKPPVIEKPQPVQKENLAKALKSLERSLYYLVDELLY